MPKNVYQNRHVRHRLNDDNTVTVRISSLPLGKKDKGNWVEQDGKFTPQRNGYATGVGETLILLPDKLNKPVQFLGSREFSIRPVDVSAVGAVLSESGDSLLYREAWPGVDIEYSVAGSGLKENIILKTAQSRTTFVFRTSDVLDTEYAPVVHTNYHTGKVEPAPLGVETTYLDKAKIGDYTIPGPIAFDANGVTVGTTWSVLGNMISIVCYPQPEHKYPITIDPVVDTPASTVLNGATTVISTPPDATALVYAKVRFTGKSTSSSSSTSDSDTNTSGAPAECDMPSVSGGTTCSHSHSASASNGSVYFVHGGGPAGSGDSEGSSLSFSGPYATGHCITTYSWVSDVGVTSSAHVSATANYTVTNTSSNPNIRANGGNWVNPTSTTANSPGPTNTSTLGSFGSGIVTAWFDIPGFILGSNTLSHADGSSIGHDYEVEYSYSVSRYQMMV
jgi:hypothetical protein